MVNKLYLATFLKYLSLIAVVVLVGSASLVLLCVCRC